MEYRYYEIPAGSPVLALLGDKWVQNYGREIDYLHFHNHLEVGFCYYGEGTVTFKEEDLPFDGNMFTVVPKNFPHTTTSTGDSVSYWEWLFIDADKFLREVYKDNPRMAQKVIDRVNKRAHFVRVQDKPQIGALVQQIIVCMREKKEFYLEEVKGLILAFLLQVARWNREEVEKAEAANADTIEEKAMAEGVEAAGEIEAVGDTGETKAFEEKQQTAKTESAKDMPKDVKRSMYFMLASIFLWFTAYNAVTTAFSRYTKVVWKMEGGSFANCLMVATVAAIFSYIPIGSISAKIGRKKTIMDGVLLMAACYGAAIFAREYHPIVNVAFALIGVAWAAINVNSYPMIVAMSSGSDVGKFTGTYYTFSMAAQILTPVLSGFLLEKVSYNTLFPYALFFSLMAFLTMTQVRHGDVKPQKKESILENFDVDD